MYTCEKCDLEGKVIKDVTLDDYHVELLSCTCGHHWYVNQWGGGRAGCIETLTLEEFMDMVVLILEEEN